MMALLVAYQTDRILHPCPTATHKDAVKGIAME